MRAPRLTISLSFPATNGWPIIFDSTLYGHFFSKGESGEIENPRGLFLFKGSCVSFLPWQFLVHFAAHPDLNFARMGHRSNNFQRVISFPGWAWRRAKNGCIPEYRLPNWILFPLGWQFEKLGKTYEEDTNLWMPLDFFFFSNKRYLRKPLILGRVVKVIQHILDIFTQSSPPLPIFTQNRIKALTFLIIFHLPNRLKGK